MNEIMPFVARWMDLAMTTLNEISGIQLFDDTCMPSFFLGGFAQFWTDLCFILQTLPLLPRPKNSVSALRGSLVPAINVITFPHLVTMEWLLL